MCIQCTEESKGRVRVYRSLNGKEPLVYPVLPPQDPSEPVSDEDSQSGFRSLERKNLRGSTGVSLTTLRDFIQRNAVVLLFVFQILFSRVNFTFTKRQELA